MCECIEKITDIEAIENDSTQTLQVANSRVHRMVKENCHRRLLWCTCRARQTVYIEMENCFPVLSSSFFFRSSLTRHKQMTIVEAEEKSHALFVLFSFFFLSLVFVRLLLRNK